MTSYNLQNPCLLTIKDRFLLSKSGSKKSVYKIIFDIKNSNLTFKPGDSLAVIPHNHPKVVASCIEAMHGKKDEPISIKGSYTLEEFLTKKANISRFPKKLLTLLLDKADTSSKKEKLSFLLKDENKEELKNYSENHELWDMLLEFMSKEVSPLEICETLLPLFPRLYSISSSQDLYKDELHLTVALVRYATSQIERYGVASHYLCEGNKDNVAAYIHEARNFFLPEDKNASIIMVGPGVGIAPFVSFLQQRYLEKAKGKNWLFFGEQNKKTDFYYEDFFLDLQNKGFLKLDLAFSRDQNEKIYVQHKMLEQAKDLWWWFENGAFFYICGNAKKMAKEVDFTLKSIIQTQGCLNENEASHYLNELSKQKRYLKDIY